ncbi:MAG: BNR-4 repeat-containing protein [Chitinophagaceae bacterium]|nr:BNR-4 repeat-containing protein [Chitinophagaceae bacterium]
MAGPGQEYYDCKKKVQGVITTTTIPKSVAKDDMYHSSASMGIDQDGYIHVTSGMHHSGWNYWVSDKPEDISSFTFLGDDIDRKPPWKLVSYATFINDRNGKLFLCYRIKVENKIAWKGGVLAGCVARYDTKSKRWTMLGGTNWALKGVNAHLNPMKTKVLVWTDKDAGSDAYEGYKPNIAVDKNNRLHLTALGQAEYDISYGTGSHAFYAYSDDSGDTWYKADSTRIDPLPVTRHNGDNAAPTPWPEGVRRLWNQSIVGFGSDLKPIVSYAFISRDNNNKQLSRKMWSGGMVIRGALSQIHLIF